MWAGGIVQSAAGWWWPIAAGLVLGAVASTVTRRFVPGERAVAGSWWLGAVLTAAVLALLSWRTAARGEFTVYGFVTVLAVPLSMIDWCEHRLPRALVWPQLGGGIFGLAVLCVVRGDVMPGARAVAALAAAGGLFLILALATGGGVGAGDVSAAAVVGAVTGWLGWAEVIGGLLVASVLALVLVALPGARRRDERGSVVVPFGPCLYGGALIMVMLNG